VGRRLADDDRNLPLVLELDRVRVALNRFPSTYTFAFAGILTPHSVKNCPNRLNWSFFASVWRIPSSACVCSGEMHGFAHGGSMPP
jgi:hypothetical protein